MKRKKTDFPKRLHWEFTAAIAEWYDATGRRIEEQLEQTYWGAASKKRAVELFEYRLHVRRHRIRQYGKDDPRSQIPCPVEFEQLILEAALLGMRKGAGKGRPPKSFMKNFQIAMIQEIGRARKAQLKAEGMSAEDAGSQAAKEAVTMLSEKYGIKTISPETMAELLDRNPNFPGV